MVERKFKEVTADFATPWRPENKGDKIEGVYIGFDEVPVKRPGRDGKRSFKSYRIKPDGSDEVFGVAGATLGRKMGRIREGTYVRIEYLGMIEVASGDEAHDFKVECEANSRLSNSVVSNPSSSDEVPF